MLSSFLLPLIRDIWPRAAIFLESPWKTPDAIAQEILAVLQSSTYWTEDIRLQVEVLGSPEHQILCILTDEQTLFCSPQRDVPLTMHPFIQSLIENLHICFDEYTLDSGSVCLTTPLSAPLKSRLSLPSVLLVSLFHPEIYPTARLTLSISYLASYLRRYHLARVALLDCQLGYDVTGIVEIVKQNQPDILGVSVNFGQFDLMEQLLDSIYNQLEISKPPIVVLGNILPAMCFREILKVYPEVAICRKEGELTLAALVKYGQDRSYWNQIPGIYYRDRSGRIVSTPPRYLPMENLPPPALDTVVKLFEHDGVITAEFSRGCQYNQCSFCPRSHKGSIWRTVPVSSMLQQWEVFAQVFQYFERSPHVFLADEDFVGREDGEATIQRVTSFLDGAQERNLRITFDASCRADQIFREGRDQTWHLSRGKLFKHCVEKGLLRLFVGVESGAHEQLLRYNKGSTVEEMISAIRYLSLLGVQLRFGFITFDPLMSVKDLIENIEFLGRTDIVIPSIPDASVEEIFSLVSSNHQRPMLEMDGRAVFEEVSYMVSPLEVLAKSRYLFDLREQAPQLMNEQIDVSFARYPTSYVVPEIGIICKACQYWVNYCFPIVYALKGLQKISQGEEKALLRKAISQHRYLGYMLIRSLAEVFSLVDNTTLQRWEKTYSWSSYDYKSFHTIAHHKMQEGQTEAAIGDVLLWYEQQIRQTMDMVNRDISVLSRSKQAIWHKAYHSWISGSLSQTHAVRLA